MPNHGLISALHDVLRKHGNPSSEDPVWATVLMLQGLQCEMLEKIMSSIQDLAKSAGDEAAALVDLNSHVAAFLAAPPAGSGTPASPGGLSAADQQVLDTTNGVIQSNIAKIGEIKSLLGTPASVPPPAPSGSSSASDPTPSTSTSVGSSSPSAPTS